MPPETSMPVTGPAPSKKRSWLVKTVFVLCGVFFVTSIVFLMSWKPWQANVKASDRTVSVTGESTITTAPDEYVFMPSYDFTDASSTTALANLSAKSNDIVAKLKALGVAASAIKSDSSGYSDSGVGIYAPNTSIPIRQGNGTTTYTLNLTITIDKSDLAQKVQNYLLTTSPTGDVSPEASFSDAKQKSLESQGRDKAEQDARSKADQSAKNLGFKVLAVKSVNDGSLVNPIMPMQSDISAGTNSKASTPTLTLQPGQNTLNYSVTVVYYIR